MGKGKKKEALISFVEGVCFLCNQPCERYVHFECASCWEKEREKKIREIIEKEKEKDAKKGI
jgi:hypothetical protein